MIKVSNLSKIFRTEEIETTALNSVSFEIKDGEFVAIMGPSGCGKSTLLNILGLLDNPTSGSYELLGTEVANLKEKERTKFRKGNIGFVFQSFNLIDELNVYENIELPLRYLDIPSSERKARVTEMMKRMNISHRAKHFPQQLSGGQQQRVAIARAVVAGPKLILADEPTGNLDSKNGKEVMDLLKELNAEGTTIVMVTHSQKDAACAQRIVNLVKNALEAIDQHGHVLISTYADDAHVYIAVQDDGPGIPPAIARTLFDAFVTSGKRGGTGLGLSIVRKIVEEHGAEITWHPVEPHGTAFVIAFPVES